MTSGGTREPGTGTSSGGRRVTLTAYGTPLRRPLWVSWREDDQHLQGVRPTMSNFAFNNPAFQERDPRAVATYPGNPQAGAGQAGQYAPPPPGQFAAAQQAAVNANLEGM